MRRYYLEGFGDSRVDEKRKKRSRVNETQGAVARPVVLASSAFLGGLIAGLFLKRTATRMYERTRGVLWHRGYKRTVTYDENLPDSLERREPAPHAGQQRFGGTGALGVSPAAAVTARPEERKNR